MSTHGPSLLKSDSPGPRCGFTLTAEEVEAGAEIFAMLLRGADPKVVARSPAARSLAGKLMRGRQRVRASRS